MYVAEGGRSYHDLSSCQYIFGKKHEPSIGWSRTQPAQELIDFCEAQGWTGIDMRRLGDGIAKLPTGKKQSSTRKYICPCCGQSVRATKAVNILCGDCMEQMVAEE